MRKTFFYLNIQVFHDLAAEIRVDCKVFRLFQHAKSAKQLRHLRSCFENGKNDQKIFPIKFSSFVLVHSNFDSSIVLFSFGTRS
jgi:hypothetical protein